MACRVVGFGDGVVARLATHTGQLEVSAVARRLDVDAALKEIGARPELCFVADSPAAFSALRTALALWPTKGARVVRLHAYRALTMLELLEFVWAFPGATDVHVHRAPGAALCAGSARKLARLAFGLKPELAVLTLASPETPPTHTAMPAQPGADSDVRCASSPFSLTLWRASVVSERERAMTARLDALMLARGFGVNRVY